MKLNTRYLWGSTFFSNDRIAALPPLYRLFLQGLWCAADREGRVENRPERLKALILPYDTFDAKKAIATLCEVGFIQCYSVDSIDVIKIERWEENGKPFRHEKPSTLPPPSKELTSLTQASDKLGTSYTYSSGYSSGYSSSSDSDKKFELFWKEYPRKVGKKMARKAFNRLSLSDDLFAEIMKALARQRKSPQWEKDSGAYIPHPSTWLNQERWNDEVELSTGDRILEWAREEDRKAGRV